MGEAKHTPGPWRIEGGRYPDQPKIRPATGPNFAMIATLNHRLGAHNDEAEANARLIAAAPDLLEALQRCLQYIVVAHMDAKSSGSKAIAERDHKFVSAAITRALSQSTEK